MFDGVDEAFFQTDVYYNVTFTAFLLVVERGLCSDFIWMALVVHWSEYRLQYFPEKNFESCLK